MTLTLHEICVATRHADCVCGAGPEHTCTCGPGGVHYARLARARARGYLSAADFAAGIHDADIFTGRTVLLDPQVPDPCTHCGGTGRCPRLRCSSCPGVTCQCCGGTGGDR